SNERRRRGGGAPRRLTAWKPVPILVRVRSLLVLSAAAPGALPGFRRHAVPERSPAMKPTLIRLAALLATLALAALVVGAATHAKVLEPGKLIILSTTDVKGKNEPCG